MVCPAATLTQIRDCAISWQGPRLSDRVGHERPVPPGADLRGSRGPGQHVGPGSAFWLSRLQSPQLQSIQRAKARMTRLTTTFQGMEFIKILLEALGWNAFSLVKGTAALSPVGKLGNTSPTEAAGVVA